MENKDTVQFYSANVLKYFAGSCAIFTVDLWPGGSLYKPISEAVIMS